MDTITQDLEIQLTCSTWEALEMHALLQPFSELVLESNHRCLFLMPHYCHH